MTEEPDETLLDIILACVLKSGINEDDLWAAYQRRCNRKQVVPLWGQLRTGLKFLHGQNKIFIRTRAGHRLCHKR